MEARLRASIRSRVADTSDPELRDLLNTVALRRAFRGKRLRPGRQTLPPRTASAPPGTILSAQTVGERVSILRVVRPPGFQFEPGQSVKLAVPGQKGSNPYTIASAPHEAHLEFCIEGREGGTLSPRLFRLPAGERVELDARAKGKFLLNRSAEVHLMIATGTGIAPFRSMLLAALQTGLRQRFVILHGSSFADELPYREELQALAEAYAPDVIYVPTVSRPEDARNRGWTGRTGRVDELAEAEAGELASNARSLQVYACGHPDMIESVCRRLERRGVDVASEAFD